MSTFRDRKMIARIQRELGGRLLSPRCQESGCGELGYDAWYRGEWRRYCARHWRILRKLAFAQRIDRLGLADAFVRMYGKSLPGPRR